MARRVGAELGEYLQMIGSFHLYEKDQDKVARYLAEGHHRLAQMPTMPLGDPFAVVPTLLEIEAHIRMGSKVDDAIDTLDPYWGDLMRLVQAHFHSDDDASLNTIAGRLREPTYRMYVEDRRGRTAPKPASAKLPANPQEPSA